MLTTYEGDEDIHRALDAGVMGYLLKDMVGSEVVHVCQAGRPALALGRHPSVG